MNEYKINAPHSKPKKYIKVEIQEYEWDGKKTNRVGKMRSVRSTRGFTIKKVYEWIQKGLGE